MVAWPETSATPFAHGFDHTGAVRHQYPTVSGRENRHWRLTGPWELSELAWSAIRIWPGPG